MTHIAERLRRVHDSSRWPALKVALRALLILLLAWVWAGNWYEARLIQDARAAAAGEIAARASALTAAINQRIAFLQGLHSYTRTEWPGAGFDQSFETYASGFYFNSTGVRTLMLAPEGIVRYIFPRLDWDALSGYDILNDPDPATRDAVQRALHTHGITLSPPGELRQGGLGLTAWQAVFRGRDLWGLASIALDLDVILAEAGVTDRAGGLELALRDNAGATFSGADGLWQREPVIEKIVLPEGAWELGGAPPAGWRAMVWPQTSLFGGISLTIVLLIAGMVYLTRNRQQQLEQAVAERTQEIAAAQKELEARVAERQRLSRDLHDSVSQVFYSIGLGAKAARAALAEHPQQAPDAIDYVSRLAEAGQVEMRALIFDLRPESLATDGLVAALERQIAVLRTRHQLSVAADICPEPALRLATKEALYRVFLEATHNIVKHARARNVQILLANTAGGLCLEVTDDGIGFDPALDYPGHLGLNSMSERAHLCAGELRIESRPGHGAKVRFELPAQASCSRSA